MEGVTATHQDDTFGEEVVRLNVILPDVGGQACAVLSRKIDGAGVRDVEGVGIRIVEGSGSSSFFWF